MKLLGFRICVLCSIALVLLPFSRFATAQSYCPNDQNLFPVVVVGIPKKFIDPRRESCGAIRRWPRPHQRSGEFLQPKIGHALGDIC
jgi:hypothetical protein